MIFIKDILKMYHVHAKIFFETAADILSDMIKVIYLIDIKKRKTILYKLIYTLSVKELQVLCKYLKTNITKN